MDLDKIYRAAEHIGLSTRSVCPMDLDSRGKIAYSYDGRHLLRDYRYKADELLHEVCHWIVSPHKDCVNFGLVAPAPFSNISITLFTANPDRYGDLVETHTCLVQIYILYSIYQDFRWAIEASNLAFKVGDNHDFSSLEDYEVLQELLSSNSLIKRFIEELR